MKSFLQQIPTIVVIEEERTYPLLTRGCEMPDTVLLNGKKYKATANEKGDIIEISRYNEKYGMFVTLKFAQEENPKVKSELLALLKSSYIQQVTGALKTT
jgi:hypothetical protein